MKPFELFKLLSIAKNRDEYIKILKANRVKFPLNNGQKKPIQQDSTHRSYIQNFINFQ